MSPELQLSELLLRWEDLRQQGKAVTPEALCRDAPELLPALSRRVRALEALGPVLDFPPGSQTPTHAWSRPSRAETALPRVPGYEVLALIGEGGMGVVYRVRNLAMDRVEALKMMHRRHELNAHALRRFQLEIRAIARLEHPRVVRIYATDQHEGRPYFTMEFVAGGSLAAQRPRFTNNPRAAAALLARVARAVHDLHTKNILHRDLKPGNILLRGDGDEPLVSDFGLAKFFDQDVEPVGPPATAAALHLTQTGTLLGTVLYASPEQAAGRTNQVTAASDVWALGVILYELLTGRRPFDGKDHEAVRRAIQTDEPPALRAVQPYLDADLEVVCLRCLRKDPKQRYPSAAGLADHLERWLRDEPILPRPWPARLWRWLRRPTVTAGVGLTAAFALLLALLSGPGPAEVLPSPLQREQRELQRKRDHLTHAVAEARPGKALPLGPNRWARWRTAEADGLVTQAAAEPYFRARNWKTGLLELLPAQPTHAHYRLRAEIHHQSSLIGENGCAVGLYFAHGTYPTPAGREAHYCCALHFDDVSRSRDPRGNVTALALQFFEPLAMNSQSTIHTFPFFEPSRNFGKKEPWHPLVVEVTPRQVRVAWKEQEFALPVRSPLPVAGTSWLGLLGGLPEQKTFVAILPSFSRRVMPAIRLHDRLLQYGSALAKELQPRFDPRGGMGLYVKGGDALIRNVTFEPLAEP